MSKKAGPIAVITILAAGLGGVILNLGGEDGKGPGEIGQGVTAEIVQMKESEVADKAVMSGAKAVRVITVISAEKDAVVSDTNVGKAVIVPVSDSDLCHIILVAPSKNGLPDVPDLAKYWGPITPVLIDDTVKDSFIWAVMFSGQSCLDAAKSPSYLASSAEEIVKLDPKFINRIVHMEGDCGDHICYVPPNDPRATSGKPWFVKHEWAGRNGDFNFEQMKDGAVIKRYKVDANGDVTDTNPEGKDGEYKPVPKDDTEEPNEDGGIVEPVNP